MGPELCQAPTATAVRRSRGRGKSLDRIRPGTELLRFSMERVAKTFLCLCRWQSVRTEANDGDEPLTAVPTEFRMQKWRRIRRSLAA